MDRDNPPPPLKRPRTKEDFYEFCTAILEHEQYELQRQEEQRKTASSPMDSAGSLVSESSSGDKDSDDEEGGDSWDVVTCYCKKPFAGRAMIECSHCLTWVHLSCAKIKKTEIPDIFWCALCKNDTSLLESSSSKTAKIKATNILKHRSEPLPSSDTDEINTVPKSESPSTSYKSSSSTRTKLLSGKSIQSTISKRGRRGSGKGKVIIQKRTVKTMKNNNDIVKAILKPNVDDKVDTAVKSSSRTSSTKTDSRVYDKPDLSDKPINES